MHLAKRLLNRVLCEVTGHVKWHSNPPDGPPLLAFRDAWVGSRAMWRGFDHCMRCGCIYLSSVTLARPWAETPEERETVADTSPPDAAEAFDDAMHPPLTTAPEYFVPRVQPLEAKVSTTVDGGPTVG